MTDTTAQSYVDQYAPPRPAQTTTPTPSPVGSFTPDMTNQPPAPSVQPPAPPSTPPSTSTESSTSKSQSLEDQNIFHLLGVSQASEAERGAFLDELQQVIWEDFLASDVDLLVTEEEKQELTKIMAAKHTNDLEQQEAIVVYLEKLIPDLEQIMLEKALELKGEMVKERIAGMREFFAQQPEKLTALNEAEKLIANERWHDAAESLNALSASA